MGQKRGLIRSNEVVVRKDSAGIACLGGKGKHGERGEGVRKGETGEEGGFFTDIIFENVH